MQDPTRRQEQLLSLIQARIETTGSPPTCIGIVPQLGFSSPGAAGQSLKVHGMGMQDIGIPAGPIRNGTAL